ncbi:MAG: hypothetical protein JXA24_02475 [Proteobacteria bacterium]|nr:hypothetical protein [Pseudomonadota bacterium]
MSMICNIPKDMPVISALAKTLGTTVGDLYGQFKGEEGAIDLEALKQSQRYAGRIYDPYRYTIPCERLENFYVVDNGDGKVGDGDLYMKADGYLIPDGQMEFRHAILGGKYETTGKEPWQSNDDPRLTAEDERLLSAVISLKGQAFADATFVSGLRLLCEFDLKFRMRR